MNRLAAGYLALRNMLDLPVPPPAVESYLSNSARRTEVTGHRTVETFPSRYTPADDSVIAQLAFALRHEPTDVRILAAVLKTMNPAELEAWIRREPLGIHSRRAWFFYETLTGRTLDVPSIARGNYVDALDPERHFVIERRNSPRHRVIDNLPGGAGMCVTVRRTPALQAHVDAGLDREARALTTEYDVATLARAVSYLYTKETRSSFEIEGETPSGSRTERFVAALRDAAGFDPSDKAALIRLQGAIVDPRYAARDWRTFQNFVGETVRGYRQRVHFICPKPEDVSSLMDGWTAMTTRVVNGGMDPVLAAAAVAFAFVFVHPFEDGNGRLHRFLIHHVLAKRGFSPPGLIFPVSASILRDERQYEQVLQTFSQPLFEVIDWEFTSDQEIRVTNDTVDLYRYFDATPLAEFLYERVADTIRVDLREELDFVAVYDRALAAVRDLIDMPDRRASLFVQLCLQNGGKLSQTKRAQFAELHDEEIARMEAAVQRAMKAGRSRGA